MTRMRTLLALALAAALGVAVAQGMMSTPNDPRAPGGGYGTMQPGYGMMGGGMMGGNMMGGNMMRVLPPDAAPLDDAELRERLAAAARTFGSDVRVDDVMPFTDHTYAQFVGPDGMGVAEVLVDRYSGVVTPEPGPNMMWNLRTGMGYGMGYGMGRGMGFGPDAWGGQPGAAGERYEPAQARELASTFLASYLPGAEILAGQSFPGYVTFDFGRDGRIEGMLSIHLGSGQVWPHTWHGAYRGDVGAHDE